jgi:hypothetical protein
MAIDFFRPRIIEISAENQVHLGLFEPVINQLLVPGVSGNIACS